MFDVGWPTSSLGRDVANPFFDMATRAMPHDFRTALNWCEFVFYGTYRAAVERIVSYFITEVEIGSVSPAQKSLGEDERQKIQQFFDATLQIKRVLQQLGMDRMCYGNALASVMVGRKRMVICPNQECGFSIPLRRVWELEGADFTWTDFKLVGRCPQCQKSGIWAFEDLPAQEDATQIKIWSPKEILLEYDPYSHATVYYWDPPGDYRERIRRGDPQVLEHVPLEVIKAVEIRGLYRFDDDVIYHMREPTTSGVPSRGWGVSRIFSNFRRIWRSQVVERYNEALMMDHIVPVKILTPAVRRGSPGDIGDPLQMMNLQDFSASVRSMIHRWRKDPNSWHTLPVPVEYHLIGGEAKALAPVDLLDHMQEAMLADLGLPVEMYRGTMQVQAMPTALRLLASTWSHLVGEYNQFLKWLARRLCRLFTWEPFQASLRPVTLADDIDKQMLLLQLMTQQSVSQTTGLRALGLDRKHELRLLAEEARDDQRIQQEIQREMETMSFGQDLAAGNAPAMGPNAAPLGTSPVAAAPVPSGDLSAAGAPAAVPPLAMTMPGSAQSRTPQEVLSQAEEVANYLMGQPESIKDSMLRRLKQTDAVLHAVVKSVMDERRQQARLQGGAMLLGR